MRTPSLDRLCDRWSQPRPAGTLAALLAVLVLVAGMLAVPRVLAQARTRSPHGALRGECSECHTPDRWAPISRQPLFRHEKTGFPLEGSHARADCLGCHRSLVFNRVGVACIDCHKDPHKGQLGTRCEACHTPRSFRSQLEIFKVHDQAQLVLFAGHASVPCEGCHRGQKPEAFASTPTTCTSCHQEALRRATNPNHVMAGFTHSCESCHVAVARSWARSTFKHPAGFPLQAAHANVACSACHAQRFTGTSRECVGCHLQAFNTAKNPNHLASGFPTQCTACHRDSGWRPATFTDHGQTRFPLTGAHERTDCTRCHAGGRYTGTPTDCVGCHQANYQAAKNPDHAAAGFSTACASCHGTQAWQPASFDHDRTRFPLSGAHRNAACAQCHVGGRVKGTATECVACHQRSFQATRNPNHVAAGFPTTCASCHGTSAWRPATGVDHDLTRFPLTGAHRGVDCAQCHTGGQFSRTPTQCFSCHQARYQATRNPNHAAAASPRAATPATPRAAGSPPRVSTTTGRDSR
jgi:hypothetical protein